MNNPENPNTAAEVYPVQPIKNHVWKLVLLWGSFYLLFVGFKIGFNPQSPQAIAFLHKSEFAIVWIVSMTLFTFFTLSKANDKLPRRFELTAEGITQIDRYDKRLTIQWEQIENLTRGNGPRKLGIEAPSIKERIFIPGHMTGFDTLLKRVNQEFQTRKGSPESRGKTYGPAASKKGEYWFVIIFFSLFALASLIGYISMNLSKDNPGPHFPIFIATIIFTVSFLVFGGGAYYFFQEYRKFLGTKLELSEEGITQWDKTGNRVFIGWNDIASVEDGLNGIKQINVKDSQGQNKIILYSNYENYEELKERICEDYISRLKAPPFPAVLGKTQIWRPLIATVFALAIVLFVGYAVLHTDNSIPGNRMTGYWVLGVFVALLGTGVSFVLRQIDQATLETNGLFLHRSIGDRFIPWEDLRSVEWTAPKESASGASSYVFLQITDIKGRTYKIIRGLNFQLKLYAFLSRRLKKS